ncbi:M16 family metallopeptidase [Qipengyuania sp. YIM B01966]|uniref:M16 family metallopeptidase n=1 Tax=Qipengyuania sp. YIM B01966 TaxID=2778646 RepID=UPI0018F347E3|nr:insulinase family protein [Qipengyuania sp. YIM B01966]
MTVFSRAARRIVLALPLAFIAPPLSAQDRPLPPPTALQTGETVPWIYRGSDVPRDREWLFGEMRNGVRYAVRRNGVPPGQVSIRIRIDAGSIHERDPEQGYAHLIEHLVFRQSKHLGPGEAIGRWQALGATFGSDTNAETSPTHTAYKLDLPNVTPAKLEESFRLLAGMMREPALSQANLAADVPIVLAEMRERGGAQLRVAEESRRTLFAGQRLAERLPIGTEATLTGATEASIREFHRRWYRPENTVVVAAGDVDPQLLASLVEKYFGDWRGRGAKVEAPPFGDPVAPAGADPANPVGETRVLVEPDLPRSLTYAVMRPWRPVNDTIVYNEGLLLDTLAQSIINRRLETRARAGGSYLYAQVSQDDVSRSADATFVTFAPLTEDWRAALADVRGVIADAIAQPPTQAEIDREAAEFDVTFASSVEQRSVMAGSKLADDIVQAVDIREAVAAPETVLTVFRGMRHRLTPAEVLAHTRALFTGDVIRGVYVTPATGEADAGALAAALRTAATPDASARLDERPVSFADLPPIGPAGSVADARPLGLLEIERVQLSNGVTALLWANDAEPGRTAVKVRFGAGYRAFEPQDAPYIELGESALVGSGVGALGQDDLDRIATGRRLGFDFGVGDGVFTFSAQTRSADLADQLYLFAAKLGMPRWDANPVLRAKAAARVTYESYSASPAGVLTRDLEYLLRDRDPRFGTPDAAAIAGATPEGFRAVWEPILRQGPVEVLIFGEFDRAQAIAALERTFGALPPRTPITPAQAARVPSFPAPAAAPVVLTHRGDANQAAAVVAWPTGGGVVGLRESRQLEILTQLFNNRLLAEMRERSGASYAPQVSSNWPEDLASGGTVTAIAQLQPADVPAFFAAADEIARDLTVNPPSAAELQRVTEPLRQLVSRASTGNLFWLYQLEGASTDPRRVAMLRTLLDDYSRTTPDAMQKLAAKYLSSRPGYRIAVLPEGESLPAGTR